MFKKITLASLLMFFSINVQASDFEGLIELSLIFCVCIVLFIHSIISALLVQKNAFFLLRNIIINNVIIMIGWGISFYILGNLIEIESPNSKKEVMSLWFEYIKGLSFILLIVSIISLTLPNLQYYRHLKSPNK